MKDLLDNIKQYNILVIGIPGREEKQNESEKKWRNSRWKLPKYNDERQKIIYYEIFKCTSSKINSQENHAESHHVETVKNSKKRWKFWKQEKNDTLLRAEQVIQLIVHFESETLEASWEWKTSLNCEWWQLKNILREKKYNEHLLTKNKENVFHQSWPIRKAQQ